VSQPIYGDRGESRVSKDDLIHALGSRITGKVSLDIFKKYLPDGGEFPEEHPGYILGPFQTTLLPLDSASHFVRAAFLPVIAEIAETLVDLLLQLGQGLRALRSHPISNIIPIYETLGKKAGKDNGDH
jgi:hypothetical protein